MITCCARISLISFRPVSPVVPVSPTTYPISIQFVVSASGNVN
ncbi:hypothetical protein [uncultured Methanobrevibacter sp.]|nr:hypothetical protein [uncultured Methanobrevibacter sp.]